MDGENYRAPARRVIDDAIADNDRLGHENLGSLSYSHGFLPRQPPVKPLPASHRVWDEVAADIPHLFRTFAVRKALDEMPILSADQADLPDEHLLRASSLFSILAHLYWYCEPEAPEKGIPPQIQRPWEQITKRLDRPAPHLSFIDLNTHNWQFIDPTLEQPFVIENLRMAIPLIGNEDERRFQMSPIEMLYVFSPCMDAILRAQEAILCDDPVALKEALILIANVVNHLTYITLQKVNPNPYSDLYINPVIWGKTAALFASPFQKEYVPGPSGTAIPCFTTLDVFFGRKSYQTTVGHEMDRTRDWFPKHWRDWLSALETVSVPDYVARKGDPTLNGIYDEARDAYAGDSGFLMRHRLKAYGFLDLSFKAGRVKTLGGMGGTYSERVWDRMANELEAARLERYGVYPQTTHTVPVKRVETLREHEHLAVRQVVFDVAETGIRYQAGDRCGIMPENSDELVDRTLKALRASGDETIYLNTEWRWHVNLRFGYKNVTKLPLRTLLKFGRIRPLDRSVALNLYGLTNNERLRIILDKWAEDQWELWDMLEMLAESGYNPRRLCKALPGDYEHICRIVPPERWRLYSISSILDDHADELHLTVGSLYYQTADTPLSREEERRGTGSSFLARLSQGETPSNGRVSIRVVHPPRFSLPQDPSRPVVMFAGGTGIAPMRGLIHERVHTPNAGPLWLFFGTRERGDFYYKDEFEPLVAEGKLDIRVAFSRDDVGARFDPKTGQFSFVPGTRQHLDGEMLKANNTQLLWEMIRSTKDGGQGAAFYLCGRTAFANSVQDTLKVILAHYAEGESDEERAEAGRKLFYRLVGEGRFMMEIFTSYSAPHFAEIKQQYNVSELVLHNDDEHGYWVAIGGRIYDVNEFHHIHPGGEKILQSYAGMDATQAYQQIGHHLNSEVDAMLGMCELGVLRMPEFGQEWGIALSDKGLRLITLRDAYYAWVDLLYVIIEIENAILNDFRVRHEPLTEIESSERVLLTPIKVQELGQTHERLVTNYLRNVLGEPMVTLWAMTTGLLGYRSLDARWMSHQLQELHSSERAEAVFGMAASLRNLIKSDDIRLSAEDDSTEDHFGELCNFLENEDRRIIRELKLAVREGVMVFEELERDTIRLGSRRLLDVLQAVPPILDGFYSRLYLGLDI